MTRRGPPGHLTPPSRGAFFLAASENSCHCPPPRQPLLPAMPISSALPIPTLPPPWLNQRCFVSVSPGRIFLPGLDSPSSSPCSSKNLRCRFSPLLAWLPRPPCLDQQSFPSSPGL